MKKILSLLLMILFTLSCTFASTAAGSKSSAVHVPANLTAKSAVVMDRSTGKTLWRKSPKVRMYPASTTKIMTALVAIENCSTRDVITVGPEIEFSAKDASKAGLVEGESISFVNLLKALMLPSGSDAAYALAVFTARKASKNPSLGEREAVDYFCMLMNKRAVKAGARSTHFTNPDGYHDGSHYSTALDISLITKSAMKYKLFAGIAGTQTFAMEGWQASGSDDTAALRTWKNTNKLLDKKSTYYYKYCVGVKTGYTIEAGHCLVSCASLNGRSVISVVLKSSLKGMWTDSIQLLDYGLKKR